MTPSAFIWRAAALFLLALVSRVAFGGDPVVITLYRHAQCNTCEAWARHLRANGFEVTVHEVSDLAAVREKVHVPERLASWHTATVAGYAIEGHVPAPDIKRLLTQRPDAAGLAVPGLPQGAPGVETGRFEAYDVLLFDYLGVVRVYQRYPH